MIRFFKLLAFLTFIPGGVSIAFDDANIPTTPKEISMGDIVGATHVGGRYHFTTRPFLKEGSDRILEMGSNSIKLWLNNAPGRNYHYNTNWGAYLRDVRSVTDLIKTPYYQEVLNLPFNTIVLMTTEFSVPDWKSGMTEGKAAPVRAELQELTEYLLTEFRGTGKTFIITNWETDNNIRLRETDPSLWDQYIQGMIDWTNARQDGIIAGRNNVGMDGVAVFGAFESNHIPLHANFDWPVTIDVVVPHTYCDIYSYSNWGTKVPGEEWQIIENLDYIASKAPPSPYFGRRNVFLGEWGAYEVSYMSEQFPELPGDTRIHDEYSDRRQREVVMRNLDLSLRWGVPYALYWQIYGNGLRSGVSLNLGDTAVEQQLRGVWLIRAPSPLYDLPYSYTSTWGHLSSLMNTNRLFDELLSFDGLYNYSEGIVLNTDEPDWSGPEYSRVGRSNNSSQWISYRTEESIRDIHALVFHEAPADGLVGWWPLDEWDGSRVFDFSGSGMDGSRNTALAGVENTAPLAWENPYAAQFRGAEWIRIPSHSLWDSDEWTLSGWFKLDDTLPSSGWLTIASRQQASGARQFLLRVDSSNGQLEVSISSSGSVQPILITDTDLRNGEWHHVALVSNGSRVQVILNGGSSHIVDGHVEIASGADLLLGAMPASGNTTFQRWRGTLDEFRFYDRALTKSEISQINGVAPNVFTESLLIEVSTDGNQWRAVPVRAEHTRQLSESEPYMRSYMRPIGELADGMRFIRFTLAGDNPLMPQLGNVALFTSDKEIIEGDYEDFRYVFKNSANWAIRESLENPSTKVAVSLSGSEAWLVHRGNAIEHIEHTINGRGNSVIDYEYSYDGQQWIELSAILEKTDGNREIWRPHFIPRGTRYIRLKVSGIEGSNLELKAFRMLHAAANISKDGNGNGWLDLEESWLGTLGFSTANPLVIKDFSVNSDEVVIGFASVRGTLYRIEKAVDLKHHIWEEVTTIEASDDWTEWTHNFVSTQGEQFYRVRLAAW